MARHDDYGLCTPFVEEEDAYVSVVDSAAYLVTPWSGSYAEAIAGVRFAEQLMENTAWFGDILPPPLTADEVIVIAEKLMAGRRPHG